jgi:hypothetical protein
MSNHVRQRDRRRGGSRSLKAARGRQARPKTFSTEAAAKKWAENQGMKKFNVINLKSEESSFKKLRVIALS